MWSLGAVAGAGWANSGDVPPDSGRGGQGSDLGVLRVRFVGCLEQGMAGGGGGGGQWRRLPRLAMPARGGPPAVARWPASYGGARGGRRVVVW
jgi:hypothetical protein